MAQADLRRQGANQADGEIGMHILRYTSGVCQREVLRQRPRPRVHRPFDVCEPFLWELRDDTYQGEGRAPREGLLA